MHHWYHNGFLTCSLYFRDRDDKYEHVSVSYFMDQQQTFLYSVINASYSFINRTKLDKEKSWGGPAATSPWQLTFTATWLTRHDYNHAHSLSEHHKKDRTSCTRQYSFNNQHFNFYRLMHCVVLIPFFHRILPIIGGLEPIPSTIRRSRVRASQLTSLLQD